MARKVSSLQALGLAATVGTLGCGQTTELGTVMTLTDHGGSNPTTAVHEDGAAYVAGVTNTEEANVHLVRLGPEGPSEAVRVNDIAGDAAPHFQAPAQVATGPEGEVYVLWTNNFPIEGRRFPASNLRFARSEDGGRTFSPAVDVNRDDGVASSHIFHDLLVAQDGRLILSWIDSSVNDLRRRDDPNLADEELPGPELRIVSSSDGGRTFTAPVIVDRNICPCCRTEMAMGPSGELYLGWRKIFPGDVRDIVVARSDDGGEHWSEPRRVHEDDWVFPGCPHAGPAMAVDGSGTLHVAWYTGKEGSRGLYYTNSGDGGAAFGPPHPLVTGDQVVPSLASLAVDGAGEVRVVWEERSGPNVRLVMAAVDPSTGPETSRDIWEGAHPSLSIGSGGPVVAWHRGDTVRVRTGRTGGNG